MSNANDALAQSAARLKAWCVNQALPFWATQAARLDGSWVEHLHLDGTPDLTAERRWRVLARQVYTYAKASVLGWYDGTELATRTYDKMKAVGYVHRVNAAGVVTNSMQDMYDHAFYILAASSLYELTRAPIYLADAEELLNGLDENLRHPDGGWKESNLAEIHDPRRQNPHMHLLEASLFLFNVTNNPKHLSYAEAVYALFQAHFFDDGTITEFFEADWSTAQILDSETAEPGHAMEWVWLLGQYNVATQVDVRIYQTSLYERSIRGRGLFLNDEETKQGEIRRKTKRLWVQTEVIKAHLAMAEAGVPGARDIAAETINALFSTYLTLDGLWHDQINANNQNIAETIPVSTFYHILCMAAESERISNMT